MLQLYTKQIIKGIDLSIDESYAAGMVLLNTPVKATDIEVAGFLTALATKGESVSELLGLIKAVQQFAIKFKLDYPVVDIVGTGGDNSNSINISTAAALLAAASGVKVIKHGNRARSSRCGSADVLEILGYKINQPVAEIIENVNKTNFGFCLAVNFNPALTHLANVRRELGLPNIFNLIAPLCNPAGAEHLIVGVYDDNKVGLIAQTLYQLGSKRSLVFSGYGLDELSCLGPITAMLVTETGVENLCIDPKELGLLTCSLQDLVGSDVLHNANILNQTLSGVNTPVTDTVILNAAAALFVYGKETTLQKCVEVVKKRLVQGEILPPNCLRRIILDKYREPAFRKSLKSAILSKPNRAIIAEIKRASPSHGKIADIPDVVALAREYVACGACAISVLTDANFSGSMTDLSNIANALKSTNAAVLCKDFFLCPEQIAEAAKAGADAILIMVSVLHHNTARMVRIAHDFGLETLVEIHCLDELDIALTSGGDIIGINQRDLRDFSMHPERLQQLIGKLPVQVVKVAESGIRTKQDALNAYSLGFNAVLVGTALSMLTDPKEFFI